MGGLETLLKFPISLSLALFCLLLMGAADYSAHFHLNLTRSDVHARLDGAARKMEVRMNDAGY